MQNSRYNKCVKIGMKSDCVLNDDELEEKRQVIIKNRIKRMKRKRFYCLITKCNLHCPTQWSPDRQGSTDRSDPHGYQIEPNALQRQPWHCNAVNIIHTIYGEGDRKKGSWLFFIDTIFVSEWNRLAKIKSVSFHHRMSPNLTLPSDSGLSTWWKTRFGWLFSLRM